MTPMHTYEVVEVRRLEVRAESPAAALLVGALRLDGAPSKPELKGIVTRSPRVVDLHVKEIRVDTI